MTAHFHIVHANVYYVYLPLFDFNDANNMQFGWCGATGLHSQSSILTV